MRSLSEDERKAYLETKSKERAEIQAKIKELSEKRAAFIKAEMEKQGLSADKAFDHAVKTILQEQSQKKGESFGR
jgi:hypothetical protein